MVVCKVVCKVPCTKKLLNNSAQQSIRSQAAVRVKVENRWTKLFLYSGETTLKKLYASLKTAWFVPSVDVSNSLHGVGLIKFSWCKSDGFSFQGKVQNCGFLHHFQSPPATFPFTDGWYGNTYLYETHFHFLLLPLSPFADMETCVCDYILWVIVMEFFCRYIGG